MLDGLGIICVTIQSVTGTYTVLVDILPTSSVLTSDCLLEVCRCRNRSREIHPSIFLFTTPKPAGPATSWNMKAIFTTCMQGNGTKPIAIYFRMCCAGTPRVRPFNLVNSVYSFRQSADTELRNGMVLMLLPESQRVGGRAMLHTLCCILCALHCVHCNHLPAPLDSRSTMCACRSAHTQLQERNPTL